jgi:hypothetical protein
MCDCVILPFNNFKESIKLEKQLKSEMVRKFGYNKPNDWKYTIKRSSNCVYAECKSQTEYH